MSEVYQLREEERACETNAIASAPAAEIEPDFGAFDPFELSPALQVDDASLDSLNVTQPNCVPATRLAISRILEKGTILRVEFDDDKRPFFLLVDRETGETKRRWSSRAFVKLVRGVREDVAADMDAGLVLNEAVAKS
ncbi:MAG: hypothetical protein AAF668_07770 [Pseudomonadota bacterium]